MQLNKIILLKTGTKKKIIEGQGDACQKRVIEQPRPVAYP